MVILTFCHIDHPKSLREIAVSSVVNSKATKLLSKQNDSIFIYLKNYVLPWRKQFLLPMSTELTGRKIHLLSTEYCL